MPDKIADQTNVPLKRTVLLAPDSSSSVIAEITDGAINTIGYSAYGEQSAQQAVATRLGFNGQLRETTIGWYLLGNGYRAYNPRLMRFHSPDHWSPFGGGGLNAYMYCVGDPVNRVDPTGHGFITILSKVVAGLGGILDGNWVGSRTASSMSSTKKITYPGIFEGTAFNSISGPAKTPSPGLGDWGPTTPKNVDMYGGVGDVLALGSSSKPRAPAASRQSTQTLARSPRATSDNPPSYAQATSTFKPWNAETFTASHQPQTYLAYPVGVGNPNPTQGTVHFGDKLPRTSISAGVGSSTHHSADRPVARVVGIRRDLPLPPRPRSPSPSPSTSRDSTPPRSRNPSGNIRWH
jgi:RHS repeat-associated protein